METFFKASPFKISTITATGGINTTINLDCLFSHIRILPSDSIADGFTYIEFGKKKSETIYRGYHKKLLITRRKKTASKRFDNQATILYRHNFINTIGQPCNQLMNIKVFKNGNIQMTGLKDIEHGSLAIDRIIEEVRLIYDMGITDVVEKVEDIKNIGIQIRLINSDFRVGFEIKRDALSKILDRSYGILCSYEPCIYPGAKIQYFWNSMYPSKDGICNCHDAACNGKGCGCGNGECKKITIAVFQSGCIIITGAQSILQIEDAYDFICKVLKNHYHEVHKQVMLPPAVM